MEDFGLAYVVLIQVIRCHTAGGRTSAVICHPGLPAATEFLEHDAGRSQSILCNMGYIHSFPPELL
jgi:hypothetical protein